MSCTIDAVTTTYALFRPGERDAERERVVRIHDSGTNDLRRGTGTSPDGRRGDYIEYTYRDENNQWFAALWWDDGIDAPSGSAVLTMRTQWDGQQQDPAQPLREAWLNRGYLLSD